MPENDLLDNNSRTSSKYIIEVENIHRSLPFDGTELRILRNISFVVERGEWVALTGPSGSGKSTLLGVLAGIDRPNQGKVRLNGVEITALPEGRLARIRNEQIGVVFQSFHLISTMTALENVEAPLFINPRRRQAHTLALEMLEQVGLASRVQHMPHQLSGGEQQRVAIARALVCGPSLLLADEPTGNLDSAASRQVLDLVRQLRKALNLTVVMVTHDPRVAAYADRRLHIVDGQLVGSNPVTDYTLFEPSQTPEAPSPYLLPEERSGSKKEEGAAQA
jgi:putative ABC transport system ATP-binding protein